MVGRSLCSLLAILLALVFVLPSRVQAENRAGALTLTPLAGAHIFKDSEHLKNSAYVGLGLGYNLTANVGLELVGTGARVQDETTARYFRYYTGTLNLLYHFRPEERFVPYLAVGAGGSLMEAPSPGRGFNEDVFASYGGGFKYFTNDWLALRVDARHAVRHEFSASPVDHGKNYGNYLISGGLAFQFGGQGKGRMASADSDGDGVLDAVDQCPGSPAGSIVASNGCPPVVDVVSDDDSDGVPNNRDECPGTAAWVKVDARGCPADSDRDGVLDTDDACPDTPRDTQVDATGCPVPVQVVPVPATENYEAMASLRLDIEFASNSSKVEPQYIDQLQRAAAFSRAHPDKVLIVEGHTDNTGSEATNRKLSQHRADTVRWILVRDYGVDAKRIKAKGFGKAQPVASNDTVEGRRANRRVLIRLME